MVGLPGEYWDMEILRDISNSVVEFVKVAEQTKNQRYTTYGRIYVYMNLSKDLPEAVSLNWEDEEWIQQIDYEQLPFLYSICHEYDHFGRNCPKGALVHLASSHEGDDKHDNEGFTHVKSRRRGKSSGGENLARRH